MFGANIEIKFDHAEAGDSGRDKHQDQPEMRGESVRKAVDEVSDAVRNAFGLQGAEVDVFRVIDEATARHGELVSRLGRGEVALDGVNDKLVGGVDVGS